MQENSIPKENRNPPKQLAGPQGMGTLLTESNERFAAIEEKLSKLLELVTELLTPAKETKSEAKKK